jgi:hypothetical protein
MYWLKNVSETMTNITRGTDDALPSLENYTVTTFKSKFKVYLSLSKFIFI